jgi:hypothetical protein
MLMPMKRMRGDPYNVIHRLSRDSRRKYGRGRNGREDGKREREVY